mgnify:CR=1 FL=1
MLRVIFDTNIYGRLVKEADVALLIERITAESEFLVYGFDLVRREIRNIPTSTHSARKSRILLLNIYDRITRKHQCFRDSKIEELAKKYHACYKQLGGTYAWDTNIHIDFEIVACASIHGMDIVYSDDQKTLASKKSVQAYNEVNHRENFRSPTLFDYEALLKKFRGNL